MQYESLIFFFSFLSLGHGFGKPVTKKIEEATDILTFLYKVLKIKSELH